MRINVARKLDYYLGPLVCRFLILLNLLLGRHIKSADGGPIENCKNILIIKFFGMGTIMLASPAFRALKQRYPTAKISILTLSTNGELCEMLPGIDEVICLKLHSIIGFTMGFMRTIFGMRNRMIDVVIDLEFTTYFSAFVTLLLTLINKPKVTIGFQSPIKWRNNAHNINVSFDHSRHIAKIFAKVMGSLDVAGFRPSFESEKDIFIKRIGADYIDKLIETGNGQAATNNLVCVNINAGDLCSHRKWPKEYFAKVVSVLIKQTNIKVVLIGCNEDIYYVSEFKKLIESSPKVIDICGRTNIKKLIALFAKSKLFISNDSGPLHLAHIIGVPTISFFGPETPYLYGPIDPDHHCTFYSDLYCSPCLNIYNSKMSHCKNNICLKSITPEMVLKIIDERYIKLQ